MPVSSFGLWKIIHPKVVLVNLLALIMIDKFYYFSYFVQYMKSQYLAVVILSLAETNHLTTLLQKVCSSKDYYFKVEHV